GEVHPFMGEFLFPSARTLTLDEAAERAGVETEMVRELRTALGLSRDGGVAETWLAQLEAFKTMQAAGLPWEAVLEGARVYGDALRRLAETEVRLVHVHVHERLSASGMWTRSEEHTSELQSLAYLVCRLLLEKKKIKKNIV